MVPTESSADPQGRGAKPATCAPTDKHDLMVVDWTPEARGDLEVAMKEGVAVLAYDCASAKLVSGCALTGTYGYIGTTRREKKIQFASADEVAANLPVGGLSWLSDVGGSFGRESALVADLVMVGKRSSAKKRADKGELDGSCDGATHFVRAATVGAFVVASGSKAELAGSAKVMGKGASGSSTSSTKIEASDGELEACTKSSPDAKTPPEQCGAVVRIELEPLGTTVAATPDLAVASCPKGFAMADGACVSLDKPHQCEPGDERACTTQCDAGHAGSCATLAVMHREDKDWTSAVAFGKRACEADALVGCRVVAAAKLDGKGGEKKDVAGAIALLDQACLGGDGMGCVELGIARLADKKAAEQAQYAFRRACYGGGENEGCAWLGTLYAEGKGGVKVNPKLAVPFYAKGCKEGSERACAGLAKMCKAGQQAACAK